MALFSFLPKCHSSVCHFPSPATRMDNIFHIGQSEFFVASDVVYAVSSVLEVFLNSVDLFLLTSVSSWLCVWSLIVVLCCFFSTWSRVCFFMFLSMSRSSRSSCFLMSAVTRVRSFVSHNITIDLLRYSTNYIPMPAIHAMKCEASYVCIGLLYVLKC